MPQLILCLTNYERQIMKIQIVIFATAISGMMALCSCSKEVMNDNRMEYDSRLTVLTRNGGENGDRVIASPVSIYVFNSEDKCVALETQEGTEPTFSVELAEGEYDVYAIGGADENRLVLPTQENAEKTAVISLKENKTWGDLMTAHSSITLTRNNKTLTLGMERKVCQIVSITITDVPDGVEDVSISIAPFYESILLDGTYQGEESSWTIPLEKQSDGTTWKKEITDIYHLPSVGNPTISIMIDDLTYSYTCEEELLANHKITIDGAYCGQGVIPVITLSGTITGIAWAGEDAIQFNFDEDGSETVNDNDEGVIDAPLPEVGSLYEGCYVLAVNGKQATVLSCIEENNIIDYGDNSDEKKRKISEALQGWSVPNITAIWELPSVNMASIIYNEKNNITSPSLGSKGYFFLNESKEVVAFSVNSGLNYNVSVNGIVFLRPVATLTFK